MATLEDVRQTLSRATLSRITGAANSTGDTIVQALDKEITPPLAVSATTSPSLVINVGNILVQNPTTLITHTTAPIGGIIPAFTSATVTFPSSGTGTVTTTAGSNTLVLAMAASQEMVVSLFLDSSGHIHFAGGTPASSIASPITVPEDMPFYMFAFVILTTNGSNVVQSVTNSDIYQIPDGGFDASTVTLQNAYNNGNTISGSNNVSITQTGVGPNGQALVVAVSNGSSTFNTIDVTNAGSGYGLGTTSSSSATTAALKLGSGNQTSSSGAFTSGAVSLTSGTSSSTSGGSGSVTIQSGAVTGAGTTAGVVNIYGGAQSSTTGTGGTVNVNAGNAGGSGTGGAVNITSGSSSTGAAGNILITGANGASGGSIGIDAGNNGTISLSTSGQNVSVLANTFAVGFGNFVIDATGDITKIRNVPYTFPSTQGSTGQVLTDSDGAGNLTWTTIVSGLYIGEPITSSTSGSVLFVNSSNELAQDNSQLFWDDTNHRFAIGTNSPVYSLQINATVPQLSALSTTTGNGAYMAFQQSDFSHRIFFGMDGSGFLNNVYGSALLATFTADPMVFATDAAERMRLDTSGNFSIGATSTTSLFNVGTSNQFQVNSTGNLVKINNVPYTWPSSQGATGTVLTDSDGAGTLTWASPVAWATVIEAANYLAVNENEVFANTTGGAFTVTLPASPVIGNRVRIADYAGTWVGNNVTVSGNSSNINGSASNFILNINNAWAEFVYTNSTQGWRVLT